MWFYQGLQFIYIFTGKTIIIVNKTILEHYLSALVYTIFWQIGVIIIFLNLWLFSL